MLQELHPGHEDAGIGAERVEAAVKTLQGTLSVERADTTGLEPDDADGWAAVARAILSADLIVTL